jgi:hypothetical protein
MKDYYVTSYNDTICVYETLQEIHSLFSEECGASDCDIAVDPLFTVLKVTSATKPKLQNIQVKRTLTLK